MSQWRRSILTRVALLLAAGAGGSCAIWKRIMAAIEQLQTQKPAQGEGVHGRRRAVCREWGRVRPTRPLPA